MFVRSFSASLVSTGLMLGILAGRPAGAQATHPNSVALPTVMQYSDRGSFTAASSGLTTLDFGTVPPIDYGTAAGINLDGVNFVGMDDGGRYTLHVVPPSAFELYQGFNGNPTVLQAGDNHTYIAPTTTITLPAGTTAWNP